MRDLLRSGPHGCKTGAGPDLRRPAPAFSYPVFPVFPMSDFDLIIRGGIVAGPDGVQPQDVGIKDGTITSLGGTVFGSTDAELDATGLYLFPGLMDAHVHFNDPGPAAVEGWETGSQSLAAGGFTSVFDMPEHNAPPVLNEAAFVAKYQRAKDSSLLDFGLWGGLTPGNLDQLEELHECGVIGFKATLSRVGTGEFAPVDDYALLEGMRWAAELGQVVAIHAENDSLTANFARQAVAEGRLTVADYLGSRPVIAELEAIQRAILLAWEADCALHVTSVSTGRAVELIASAREQGLSVSCETSPHYLIFTEEDAARLGAVVKCAPPLRTAEEVETLWEQVRAGNVDFLASAHSPCPPERKGGDIFSAWAGIAAGQLTLPLILNEGGTNGRAVPLERLAELLATNVARRFRLHPQKGELTVGADGDVVIFDLGPEELISAGLLLQRHPELCPYLGRTLRGQVRRTILRGQTVYKAGAVIGRPTARLLRPALAEETPVQ